jgi:hypothetical protein
MAHNLSLRALLLVATACVAVAGPKALKVYPLALKADAATYDETVALATIQGVLNREAPEVYVLAQDPPKETTTASRANYWLKLLSREGEWLAGRPQQTLAGLDELVAFAGQRLKGAVIWDPAVPATLNVATTIAGVRDAVVLSPELAATSLARWRLPVLEDLRGRFSGAETGSAKNDAYRWALREYLAKGRCSSRFLCLFADSFTTRAKGEIGYAITRDWAVKNRAFVLDLSVDRRGAGGRPRTAPRPRCGDLPDDPGRELPAERWAAPDRADGLLRVREIQPLRRQRQPPRTGANRMGNRPSHLALQRLPEHGFGQLLQPVAAQPRAPTAPPAEPRGPAPPARAEGVCLYLHGRLRLGQRALRCAAAKLG